jgi:hypothetical protein
MRRYARWQLKRLPTIHGFRPYGSWAAISDVGRSVRVKGRNREHLRRAVVGQERLYRVVLQFGCGYDAHTANAFRQQTQRKLTTEWIAIK